MWVWTWAMAMAGEPTSVEESPSETVPAPEPEPAPVEPPKPAPVPMDPSMRGHFEKATTAMLAVALGQVDVARDSAGALADAPGVPPVLQDAAKALEKCGRLECATERVSEMARTCAECHLDTGHGPRPRNLTTLPGATARERHIYAATFAWVGLVTPKQPLFLFGLANVVPPVEKTGGTKQLVEARDAFRAAQQASVSAETLEDRSAAFAGLLAACAGCHDVSGVPAK